MMRVEVVGVEVATRRLGRMSGRSERGFVGIGRR